MRTRRGLRWVGVAALLCFAVHNAQHVAAGRWWSLLWLSNLATLLLGGALAAGAGRAWCSPLCLWLLLSTGLWVVDVAFASAPIDTAMLTHPVAFALALVVVRRTGYRSGSWREATAGLFLLGAFCRWATPPEANINLVFGVPGDWHSSMPPHAVYLTLLGLGGAGLFFLGDRVLARSSPNRGKPGTIATCCDGWGS